MLDTYIKIMATIYTLVLMAVVTSLLLFGGYKIKSPMIKGKVIQATMVDISQLKPNKKAVKKQTIKKAEPRKEEIKKQVKKIEPKKKDPPRIVKKEPKVDITAQELERKKRVERQKKLKKIQQQRKKAEQESKRQKQELKDLADKIKNETKTKVKAQQKQGTQKGQSQADIINQMMAQYQLAVITAVERQWNKPASVTNGLICHVKVKQIPGGGVIDASIGSPCNANSIVKKSIISAIKKANPLPYKGFEKVFDRSATFIFQPQD